MNILYLLVPLASLLALGAALAFVWGAKRGQLDDLVTPALRMLHDDEPLVASQVPHVLQHTPNAGSNRES